MRLLTLVGLMGAGKSTVGPLLAARLGVAWRDLDHDVSAMAGASIPEIFAREGEAGFRRVEREALLVALADGVGQGGMVLATGGGTPAQPGLMAAMTAASTAVYLRCSAGLLARRTFAPGDETRPLLADCATLAQATDKLGALLAAREPFYAQAQIVIDVADDDSPEALVDRILTATASLGQEARRDP